jgi:hypothetical protein
MRVLSGLGDLFQRSREIAVLVQIADDVVGRVAHVSDITSTLNCECR